MAYGENRGSYWRGRYRDLEGELQIVKDEDGNTIRFRNKSDAKRAANAAEAEARKPKTRAKLPNRISFPDFVNIWYSRQDLALSSMQNYRHHIEDHLLPAFQEFAVADITRTDIALWEKQERALGYAESSIKTWRSTLHLILADAVEEGIMDSNPAARRRNRGKRAGRSRRRGPEKAVTTALGILLIAERAALLSGRDEEFIAIVTKGFTGMRFGELVGLETQYVREDSIRIEWQLYELDTGELHRCPPKDDSYRDIYTPRWLTSMIRDHTGQKKPTPCPCHGYTYVFSGHRPPNHAPKTGGPTQSDVARRAGVSVGLVSTLFNHPERVSDESKSLVADAIADLGYVRGGWAGELAPHWRRSGFATWLFQPATTGSYPSKGKLRPRPVPVLGEPWPGIPVRGRKAADRADACWLPIKDGLTPHGERHTYKTLMDELGTPSKLKDHQMGHEDGSVQAGYSHITDVMIQRLMDGLTELWGAALAERRKMSPGSPVAVLDHLLRAGGQK